MAAPADGSDNTASPTTLASVVVMRIAEFTRKPVAEQFRLKERLDELLTLAIRPVPAAARIVLDAPEGVAVVVLDGPGVALEIARQSQFAAGGLRLFIGLNYGPVQSALDAIRGPGLIGDGLTAGVTLSNAAKPGRFVASRSFREALKVHDPRRVRELGPAGTYTDAQLRAHELFALDWRPAFARRFRLVVYGTLAIAASIGAGFTARLARLALEPPPVVPAIIRLDIKPRGDVLIDGVPQGASPPLTDIEVHPGPHTIEVRNHPSPPLRLEVTLGSGEGMTITHSFAAPAPAARTAPKSTVRRTEKKTEKKVEKNVEKKAEESRRKTPGDYWRQFRRDIGL
jgi:class 3 adenylate cyclase